MIDPSQVLEEFRKLAGLESDELERWRGLALGCAERLIRQVRPDANPETARHPLALAAAGQLFYQMAVAQASAGENVRLADLSVSPCGSPAQARALRDELLAGAAPYLLHHDAFLVQVVPDLC